MKMLVLLEGQLKSQMGLWWQGTKGCDINLKMYSNEVPFMIQITNFVTDEFLKDS